MKKISECLNMQKEFEIITAMDFRRSPGEVLTSVDLGKVFIVTKSGRPIAVISKPPGEQLSIVVDRKGKISYER